MLGFLLTSISLNRREETMKSLRKMLALLLCLSLFAGLVPAAWAEGEITFDNESLITEETFDSYATDVFPDSIGLTQQTSYTCTLASAAMMLRGRMFRRNNNKWSSVTESSIKPVAWDVYGSLGYSWTYSIDGNSMTVSHRECSGFSFLH